MSERLYEKKPGPIRRKAKPGPDETMESLRETRNTPRDRAPKRLGEIEVGRAGVEVGYDEKRRRLHMAFLQERDAGKARGVVESSAARRRAGEVEYGSNDGRFRREAVDLRAAPDRDARKVLRDLREAERRQGCAALERVLPLTGGRDGPSESAFADALKETVEPLSARRAGDDLLLLLRKKQGEEEEDGLAARPAEEETEHQEKGVEQGSR